MKAKPCKSMTTAQACERIGISRQAFWRWVGKLGLTAWTENGPSSQLHWWTESQVRTIVDNRVKR